MIASRCYSPSSCFFVAANSSSVRMPLSISAARRSSSSAKFGAATAGDGVGALASASMCARTLATNGGTAAFLLSGIVEADEAYIGGKPRKSNRRDVDHPKHARGRGTDKLPVVGAVERGGKVVAEPSPDVTSRTLGKFLWKHIDKGSLLITDEYPGYRGMNSQVRHATINHSKEYANGLIHTNTIEGFWGLLKRAWFGSHHHYTRKHALSYIVEACYKYNTRRFENPFARFLQTAVAV